MFPLLGLMGLALAGSALVETSPQDGGQADDSPDPDATTPDRAGDTDGAVADMLVQLVEGGDTNDELYGSAEADRIAGRDGDDHIDGREGDDILAGGPGADILHGYDGADSLTGDAGADTLHGCLGDDLLDGGDGDDKLVGGAGDDSLTGGAGADSLLGGFGNDTLIGGDGDDHVDGATGEDSATRDFVNGDAGADHVTGGAGDFLDGGSGTDTFAVMGADVTVMDYTPGEDSLILHTSGAETTLSSEVTDDGVIVKADGEPLALLRGLETIDLDSITVQPARP
ncbi:MAG: calcium-binding protein [Salibaculum sp.]|uniref:calcium-binding protein n=1 Tax=Salibaculum sp. TaxID=2855480 RepID=UPI00286FB4C1|nr:calcium-binding protein [Salibaculum sp.]MDR9427798.1 calcium-binding protein [Salibaculum sp.]